MLESPERGSMEEKEVHVIYSSPPSKRKLAKGIFWFSAAIAVLLTWSLINSYQRRKAKGYDPLPASSLVMYGLPLMLGGLGLWIGWGQVRIDLKRGVVERRPLGLPYLGKTKSLSAANRIYVGFYRAPTSFGTANSGVVMRDLGKGTPYWFARLEGEGFQVMLIVQRPKEEALAFAHDIGGRFDLAVEVADDP